jgi:tetratricopeptide (TPR) repeat protein
MTRPSPSPALTWPVWPAAVIALAAFVVYAASIHAPFVFDDVGTIVNNVSIRDLGRLAEVLAPPSGTAVSGRPLVNLSFALNYAAGGLSPVGYRVTNIAIHALCALLLFAVGRRSMIRAGIGALAEPAALTGALIWLVHPLNSEAVDYVTQRTELLMALCFMCALYAAIRAHEPDARRRWQLLAVGATVAGAWSKETIAVLPIIVLLWDRAFAFPSYRTAWAARRGFYLALAGHWAVLGVQLAIGGQAMNGGLTSLHVTPWAYFLNQPPFILRYLWLTVWPVPLVNFYGWASPAPLGPGAWLSILAVAALASGAVAAFMRRPRVGFAAVAVFILLGPTSSFIPIPTEVAAERRMYLPLMAVSVGLAAAGVALARLRPSTRRPLAAAAAVVILAFSAGTMRRHRDYRSALALAQSTLDRWPTPNAHQLVGVELAAAGRHDEAVLQLTEAARTVAVARYWLGAELLALGRDDEALDALGSFVRDEPDLPPVPKARVMMARVYAARGDEARAVDEIERALAANPNEPSANGVMADVKASRLDFAGAVPHYTAYLAANRGDAGAWNRLGMALANIGRLGEAQRAMQQAASIDPANAEYRANLARLNGGR